MATNLKISSLRFSADNTEISSRYFILPKLTKMIFNESSAPTGWTQDTTTNDTTLRVVNSSGGSTVNASRLSFSSVFTNRPFDINSSGGDIGGLTIGATTLTSNNLPQHSHPYGDAGCSITTYGKGSTYPMSTCGNVTRSVGGGGSHTHPVSAGTFTATASEPLDFSIKYVSCIMCSLN